MLLYALPHEATCSMSASGSLPFFFFRGGDEADASGITSPQCSQGFSQVCYRGSSCPETASSKLPRERREKVQNLRVSYRGPVGDSVLPRSSQGASCGLPECCSVYPVVGEDPGFPYQRKEDPQQLSTQGDDGLWGGFTLRSKCLILGSEDTIVPNQGNCRTIQRLAESATRPRAQCPVRSKPQPHKVKFRTWVIRNPRSA